MKSSALFDLAGRVAVVTGGNGGIGRGIALGLFLQGWAQYHDIRLKLFNPRQSVRYSLAHADSTRQFDIATLDEMMAILVWADSRYARAA